MVAHTENLNTTRRGIEDGKPPSLVLEAQLGKAAIKLPISIACRP